MYAAKIEDGVVTQAIVGDVEWATDRIGGVWVASETKVGIGWEQYDGGLRPPQPFPSWSWDGAAWIAPVPMPDDGLEYVWDEAAGEWVAISDEMM